MPDNFTAPSGLGHPEPASAIGTPLSKAPVGDSNFIQLRSAAGGIIDNVEQTLGGDSADAFVTDGIFYVGNASTISLWVDITLGSLTSVTIRPQFADTSRGTWYYVGLTNEIPAGALSTISPHALGWNFATGFATGGTIVISVPNPGGTWGRFRIGSSGTTTDSSIVAYVSRGWSDIQYINNLLTA